MRHFWKKQSLEEVVRYNKGLLMIVLVLSALSLVLAISLTQKEEKWILVPALDIDRKFEVTNKNFHESYLKEWARSVVREMFTTSPHEIDSHVADIRRYSSSNKDLDNFFQSQMSFIKGSNVSSVFYFKSAVPVGNTQVEVTGTFHYWFADSQEKIAEEKSYLISYKRTARGLILLTNIEEMKKTKDENKS